MNKLLLTCVCMCVSGAAVSALPFQEIIGEDAEFFCTVRSLSETRAQWATHPIAALFEDAELLAFFDAMKSDDTLEDGGSADEPAGFTEVMEDVFGLSYDELFELFPGQASLAFYNLSGQVLGQAESEEMVLMVEFSGDAARLDTLMKIQFERNMAAHQAINPLVEHELIEESFMGETLYFDETFNGVATYIEDGYALVDGIVVLAAPESRLRAAVESIKEGASAPIADSAVYQRSREQGGRGDFGVYSNLEKLMPTLNRALIAHPAVNNLAIFGVTAQSLDSALSLESLQALYVDFDLIDSGLLSHYGLIYREKLGFLSLMSYANTALPEAHYVAEGALSSSISTFDCSAMLANFERLLTSASPTLPPLIDMQLQIAKAKTGVDLRAALLDNFGSQTVSLSVLPEAHLDKSEIADPQQLFVIEVKDAQALAQAIEAFKDLAPSLRAMIEEQMYEGQTIYTIRDSGEPDIQNGNTVSYALLRSSLIVNVGELGLLHKVLTRMSEGGEGLWQSAETEELFERIERPNAVTRSFVNAELMVEPLFESLLQMAELSGLMEDMSKAEIPSRLDSAYRMISELNEAPDGFFGRTLIIKSEGK
jgi:hypothetical protein